MLGVLPGDHRLAPGERGAQARARDRRAARRPAAALRRARRVVHRGHAPPRPGLPGLRRAPDDHRVHRLRRVLRQAEAATPRMSDGSASRRRSAPTTAASARCQAAGDTVRELLDDLMARFPACAAARRGRRARTVRERLRRRRGRPHARRARHAGARRLDRDPPAGDGRWARSLPPRRLACSTSSATRRSSS